jgi:hypothetical protein
MNEQPMNFDRTARAWRPSEHGLHEKPRAQRRPMGREPADNNHSPRFEAWAGPDTLVEAADDLDELLDILRELVAVDDAPEDLAVWTRDCVMAAVVLYDGSVIRFAEDEAGARVYHGYRRAAR